MEISVIRVLYSKNVVVSNNNAGTASLMITVTIMYGVVGGLAVSATTAAYEIKVDLLSGTTILQQKIRNLVTTAAIFFLLRLP